MPLIANHPAGFKPKEHCLICHTDDRSDNVVHLTCHRDVPYHESCIRKWAHLNPRCPLDQRQVTTTTEVAISTEELRAMLIFDQAPSLEPAPLPSLEPEPLGPSLEPDPLPSLAPAPLPSLEPNPPIRGDSPSLIGRVTRVSRNFFDQFPGLNADRSRNIVLPKGAIHPLSKGSSTLRINVKIGS